MKQSIDPHVMEIQTGISINISGGTGNPSSFNWSWLNVPAGTVDSVYSLTEGMYFIEILDSLGCNFLDSIYVDG